MKKKTLLTAALISSLSLCAPACTDDDDGGGGDSQTQQPQGGAITVLSPNGGETWSVGQAQEITWDADDAITDVTIRLSKDGGDTWPTVITPTFDTSNASWPSFSWTPTAEDTCTACRVRIEEYSGSEIDVSDRDFVIE